MINITMLSANRPRLLKQALDSIGDLTRATVTIRDAGMNQEALRIVREWGLDKPAAMLSNGDKVGTGQARNQVIDASEVLMGRGSLLYLSDDDVYFTRPDWLNILVVAYNKAWDAGYRVLGAYNHPYHLPIDGESWTCVPPVGVPSDPPFYIYPVHALALQSMLMKWEVWDEFGPFPETPAGRVCQGEDVEFGNRIKDAGFRLGVIKPPLLVNCGVTNSFGDPIPGVDLVRAEAPAGVIVE